MTTGIITAASEKYSNSLFSLIGSLNCNWPDHPPIMVYDLGLDDITIEILREAGVEVRTIPEFCSHWRLHYTWKLWCFNHSEFDIIIWMDAGLCALQPLNEVIDIIKRQSYFCVPHYQFLDYEATEQACYACGVDPSFRFGKGTITTAFIGFRKDSLFGRMVEEAYHIGLNENNIKVYNSRQRPEQSIIAILTYKYFPNPELVDGIKFLGWKSPRMVSDQKVWQQRRQILKEDVIFFRKHLKGQAQRHMPKDPVRDINLVRRLYRKSVGNLKTFVKGMIKKENINGVR